MDVLSQPVTSWKRFHDDESVFPAKKQKKWSDEEQKFLQILLIDLKVNKQSPDWKLISSQLNSKFNSNRAAKTCQTFAKRMDMYMIENVRENNRSDVGCQTDISFDPKKNVHFIVDEPSVQTRSSTDSFLRLALLENVTDTDLGMVDLSMNPAGDNIQDESIQEFPSDHNYNRKEENESKRRNHIGAPQKRLQKYKSLVDRLSEKSTAPSLLTFKECFNLSSSTKTRDISTISSMILSISDLRKQVITDLSNLLRERPEQMFNKKFGFVSVLMEKDYKALETTQFEEVIDEFHDKFPEILEMLTAIMMPKKEKSLANFVPRLAMIYGILMQSRHHELSRMQRMISMVLSDNICDQSVYDRLNRVGVSTSYTVSLSTVNQLGKRYPDLLVEALKAGKYVRLVGDNLNFSVGTSNETRSNHKHMVHMFASSALISDHLFLTKPNEPEISFEDLAFENIILQREEYASVRKGIVPIILDMVVKYLPQLSFLKDKELPRPTTSPKTIVVPLPCLPYNEQYLQDDVKILSWYQNLFQQIITESGADPDMKFQIGGDQLTRERLTEAMLLRLENPNPQDRFANIGRCVFEFFHLGMNYLEKVIFGEMWNKKGIIEMGTLRGECERISRKGVNDNIMKAYEEDKKFVISYTTANLVVALMHFFGMETATDNPTKNCPEPSQGSDEIMENFVDQYIFPVWSKHKDETQDEVSTEGLKIKLDNGMVIDLQMITKSKAEDKIKDYAHYSLEAGMSFIYLLKLIKGNPDRQKMFPLLKMMMIQLRGHCENAKYPNEILRMLVQQYSVMGLQEACQVFQACFVNLHGVNDGFVPADLVQEWNVKEAKKHIKHMYSNKLEMNISNRTSALPSVHNIADNFDKEACTVVRSKKHVEKDNEEDELFLRFMVTLRIKG